jgi:cysteine-rich repeat protein
VCPIEPVNPPAACGNGVLEAGEECDDGNLVENDGCSSLCTAEAGMCVPSQAAHCGDVISASNDGAGSNDRVDLYSCRTWNESGPEMVYTFSPTTSESITLSLNGMTGGDLDLFLIQAGVCAPDQCVASGNSELTYAVTAGETYFIVVDGYDGAVSPFELSVQCGQAAPTCSPEWVLGCGGTDTYNNGDAGSTDVIDSYPCWTWEQSGPEYTYSFEAPADGAVTVALSGLTADLDVFVLNDLGGVCGAAQCVSAGDSSVTFDAVGGQTYYLVVDGYNGAVSDYTIAVTCN